MKLVDSTTFVLAPHINVADHSTFEYTALLHVYMLIHSYSSIGGGKGNVAIGRYDMCVWNTQ